MNGHSSIGAWWQTDMCGSSSLLCFTAALASSVHTRRHLWRYVLYTRVNVAWNPSMVAYIIDSAGLLCRPQSYLWKAPFIYAYMHVNVIFKYLHIHTSLSVYLVYCEYIYVCKYRFFAAERINKMHKCKWKFLALLNCWNAAWLPNWGTT